MGTNMETLLPRDHERMQGLHPHLVRVVIEARKAAPFIVLEGLRSRERQAKLVALGASRTMNSRHLTGHAVDLAAKVGTEIRWDWPLYEKLNTAMQQAAKNQGTEVTWGGSWTSLRDGPHFEISPLTYGAA